jgi:hypothetical protein
VWHSFTSTIPIIVNASSRISCLLFITFFSISYNIIIQKCLITWNISYNKLKFRPIFLENAGLCVATRTFRDPFLFNADFKRRVCLSNRSASVGNAICSDSKYFYFKNVLIYLPNYMLKTFNSSYFHQYCVNLLCMSETAVCWIF